MGFLTFKPIGMIAILLALPVLGACSMQRRFDDPHQAVSSLVGAMRAGDTEQLRQMLGKEGDELLYSGDPVNDRANVELFLKAYDQKHQLVPEDEAVMRLDVGNDDWPMPIPLVKDTLWNNWYFDTGAGKEEILNRRIGRNELDTMQVCLAIADAEAEYAQRDPEKVGYAVYAGKFFSDPGRKNGLYWETGETDPPSPLGPLAASAESMGYTVPADAAQAADKGPHPFHGYFFRILHSQGPAAAGGARDYLVGDRMIGGFAILAYPATYGTSGIMTFMTNQDGVLYQRDLGSDTAKLAPRITSFNPDAGWTRVEPPEAPATQPGRTTAQR